MKINWTIIWEATKEPLREIALALIPVILIQLQTLNVPWATILYLILRSVDSILHEVGKANSTKKDESDLTTGLTRF